MLFNTPLSADEKAERETRIKALRAEVADAEKKLADLKNKLALELEPVTYHRVDDLLAKGYLEVGEEGPLGKLASNAILDVTGPDSFVWSAVPAAPRGRDPGPGLRVIVRGVLVNPEGKARAINPPERWRVVGREQVSGVEYTVLRPAPPAGKK
jgi:hypothetical protein